MLKHYLILFTLGIALPSMAQWPATDRLSEWSVREVSQIQLPENYIDFKAYWDKHSFQNMSSCVAHILDSLNDGGTVFFDSGTYHFSETITLSSNQVLLGAGSSSTHFIFNLNGANKHAIHLKGKIDGSPVAINHPVPLRSTSISTNGTKFNSGDLVKIYFDDQNLVNNSWAEESIAQYALIESESDSTVLLNEASRLDLTLAQNPKIQKVLPVENCVIANLSLERVDATAGQTSTIRCDFTNDCSFIGLESNRSNFAHIDVRNSYKTTISGCYFHHGHSYGSGGKAYGVVLEFSTSSCFVASNIFSNLRHSILFQAGSNGNVIYGNYSREAYWTDVMSPTSFGGDIVLHGNGPFRNLVELNVCQNLVIDNSHGTNGRNNLFYRNRAEHAGIFMNCSPASDGQIFISNEVTGSGFEIHNGIPFPRGLYVLCGEDHLELNNAVQGQLRAPNDQTKDTASFFKNNSTETSRIGYPKANSNALSAQKRFSSQQKTVDLSTDYHLGFQFNYSDAERAADQSEQVTIEWETTSNVKGLHFQIIRIGKTRDTLATLPAIENQTAYTYTDSFAPPNQEYTYEIWYSNRMGFHTHTSASISSIGTTRTPFQDEIDYPFELFIWTLNGKLVKQIEISRPSQYQAECENMHGLYVLGVQKDEKFSARKIWFP